MEKGIATSTNPFNMLDFNEDDDGDDKLEDNEMKREELDGLESPSRVPPPPLRGCWGRQRTPRRLPRSHCWSRLECESAGTLGSGSIGGQPDWRRS